MTNLLQTSATWLGQQLQAHAGRVVSVDQVNGTRAPNVTATLAMSEHEVIDEEGFLTRVVYFDWTFVASDLGFWGLSPRSGDTITETVDGEEWVYEALPIGKRPAVEYLDSSGLLLTVHTKRVQSCA